MDLVYIKYLPKDKLLYELWLSAKPSRYFYLCKELLPTTDLSIIKNDINHMIVNGRRIDLTVYYGRRLYIDITDDTVDCSNYDMHNGYGVAEKIIERLKEDELRRSIVNYIKFT